MFWAARALHWLCQQVFCLMRCGVWVWGGGWRKSAVIVYLPPADSRISPWWETAGNSLKRSRAGDRRLQLFVLNEEFLVSARHQRALNLSLLFVHTARRCYRSNGLVSIREGSAVCGALRCISPVPERLQTVSFRGSKSRNKVSVGEPADGSLACMNACMVVGNPSLLHTLSPCVSGPPTEQEPL